MASESLCPPCVIAFNLHSTALVPFCAWRSLCDRERFQRWPLLVLRENACRIALNHTLPAVNVTPAQVVLITIHPAKFTVAEAYHVSLNLSPPSVQLTRIIQLFV